MQLAPALLVLAQIVHGTSGPVPPTHGDWVGRDTLPLLRIEPLLPRKDAALFDTKWRFSASYRAPTGTSLAGPAYERDDQAVQASIAFLRDHFDTSQYDLVPARVDHSSLGDATPRSADDHGHTIVLDAVYHGLILHGHGSVVYLSGRTVSMATVMLGSVAVLPGTERPVIPKKRAVRIWQDAIEKQFHVKNATPGGISLQYVYSIAENHHDAGSGAYTLSPNWIIEFENGSGELLVDAREGTLWRND